ncbi:MAG: Dabb family protein [Roseofilum sp. SBFL]|nr:MULTISPECIES: Dabb family protein [unclassified Roseofilum]MBP0011634.1 Dabb family protein [Roseofilum sp. SID3]MBP0025861.1 Dabb family protein [Roseofilum sp. SID2]MBP0040061.1 Dabb family protein [Roseofilum sp. SID1]MBP0044000.1 Dabb family protein [Roseofilum sp. SBFL]
MIEHIVLFQFKPDASSESLSAVVSRLRELKGKIPQILALSCGENFCDRAQGFTHGLVARFQDSTSLQAYQDHPAHQEVVQTLIKPIAVNILAMDYEIIEDGEE